MGLAASLVNLPVMAALVVTMAIGMRGAMPATLVMLAVDTVAAILLAAAQARDAR